MRTQRMKKLFSAVAALSPVFCFQATAATTDDAEPKLDEIIVTATKREVSAQEVPISITALSQAALERTGADSFKDYLALAPGVAYNEGGGLVGSGAVTMRGIAASFGQQGLQQTTEVFIDDLPSLARFRSYLGTDLRTFDVERIEILRGPQGTLFGSGAMGGAIRLVTNKPDATKFNAVAELGGASTHGGEGSYSANGMLNLPLVENKLAMRLVGYDRDDGGYVHNVTHDKDDVNHVRSYGGRALLSYLPNDRLSLRLTLTGQKDRQDDSDRTFLHSTDGGALDFDSIDANTVDIRTDIANLTAEYDLGFASLLSSSTYAKRDILWLPDETAWANRIFGTSGDVFRNYVIATDSKVQEIRLTSHGDGPFQWIGGLFYLDQDLQYNTLMTVQGLGAAFDVGSDLYFDFREHTGTKEKAVFGELSYKLPHEVTLTAGARWFENTVAYELLYGGEFAGPSIPYRDPHESAVTPKVSVSYQPMKDLNLYALASKGYRTGQNNYTPLVDPNTGLPPAVPPFYGPDSLWNYEIGMKSLWLDSRLKLNVAAFYIDWKDIQLTIDLPIGSWVDNAGSATSKGLELELQAALTRWAEFGSAFTYTDATIDKVKEGVAAVPGQRLPGTAKYAVSNYLQFTRSLPSHTSGYLRLDHRYTGKKAGDLSTVNLESESYGTFNIRTGLYFSNYELALYVNNLTNEEPALTPSPGFLGNVDFTTRPRPRTIGATFRMNF
ncbi:MAG: TonB-dependent receptor [Gammaproteobacteria bacterium]